MCHAVLDDPAFFRFLLRIDEDFAAKTRRAACPHCGAALHRARYPRKPRGCPASVMEEYSWRFSFTCGRCNARATPPSVRFLGRRVYVAVALMLFSPPGNSQGRQLCELLSISVRTLQRWRTWWLEDFPFTPFWRSVRERFMPPVTIARLPQSLMERFAARAPSDWLPSLLCFVAPLSTRAAPN